MPDTSYQAVARSPRVVSAEMEVHRRLLVLSDKGPGRC